MPSLRPLSVPRRGFTLVELVVVITIIAILMALLLPALMGAFRNARDARVRTEISSLESAIAAFKATFGMEPPSRIVLFEVGADGADAGGNDWDDYTTYTVLAGEVARSRGIVRRMWPQFDFSLSRDINGDGDSTDIISLNAGECLFFFLGGTAGFAKNPTNPFTTAGTTRDGPFFEFDVSRLTDIDGDGMSEYKDSLPDQTAPYYYFSSYGGKGYDATDLTGTGLTDFYNTSAAASPARHKPTSFQIISPGVDKLYGTGGYFNPSDAVTSLANGRPTTPATDPNLQGKAEYDNITNFHGGRLLPQ